MRKTILIGLLAVVILAGCEKEDTRPDCEKKGYYNLEITNGSNDTYMIHINNKYINDVKGKQKKNYIVPKGFTKVYVKQKDGYILFATEKTYERTGKVCENLYLIIP